MAVVPGKGELSLLYSFLCDDSGQVTSRSERWVGMGARGAWWVIHLKQHHYMFPKPGPLQAVFPQTCDSVWGYRSDLSLGYSRLDTWNVFANLNSEHLIKTSLENKTSLHKSTFDAYSYPNPKRWYVQVNETLGETVDFSPVTASRGVHGQPDLSAAIPVAL